MLSFRQSSRSLRFRRGFEFSRLAREVGAEIEGRDPRRREVKIREKSTNPAKSVPRPNPSISRPSPFPISLLRPSEDLGGQHDPVKVKPSLGVDPVELDVTSGLVVDQAISPLHRDLVPPQPIAVEGCEAVDHNRDGEDEGEDAEDGADGANELAGSRLRLVLT